MNWPHKCELFGIGISATEYGEATRCICDAARAGKPGIVSLFAVHALVTASRDPQLQAKVNTFDLIGPDGQPVRWALNLLHGARLRERVYGPELMLKLCARAEAEQLPIFLYGGTPKGLAALEQRLTARFPELPIAGSYAPPFRRLTPEEDAQVVRAVRESGARLVFIGLGAPKQDLFAFEHRDRFDAVQICVGAAFDFHAGTKRMAPRWMQAIGLEWLFRLSQEPRRLVGRYARTNSIFLLKLSAEFLRRFGTRRLGAEAASR